ncbi:class II aaRS and biotin synthetase [Sporormia fimetaria CBS 119925]|uniref:Class II aaRS and biotin synthetase n=1 Tax=Sporormia fimetaria CBS 119925 TaxID=1340428 RepID=A0A6A6UU69_9PLEO|nr:class II aaRS and biotin synthetase [Sporormia fimetaria CBS 119925]
MRHNTTGPVGRRAIPSNRRRIAAQTHARSMHSCYTHILTIQDALFHETVLFFKAACGYKYAFVPTTTNAISSPMGLGSDSEPVPIAFLGEDTHLADSMQFALEYSLRIEDGLAGAYYGNTSFRGEDPDAMHLNQFYHVECELPGHFEDGIIVAERYHPDLTSMLLRNHRDAIAAFAGTTKHIEDFLASLRSSNSKLPRITLDAAIELLKQDKSCWKYAVKGSPRHGPFGGAVWLTEIDHLSVPFYQAFTDPGRKKAKCADLLLGNGEVLGLGERHKCSADVLAALKLHDVPPEAYEWYMGMRDQKDIQTTGWGMGIERFLAWVFQHDDIRDLVAMPRMKGIAFHV